ncbi:putative 1,2-alpha-mannosidase [Rhizodiscina lignyota]|uniref:alpha-1,2-Mannosidase n=1 Tax=Rhizodiscina lignyota TaxID=1504668 RepID=A0A9P4M4E2_9PEZI|nr:putative 1,2-alpha-mannosidase [Rhizodiscina lignyota]
MRQSIFITLALGLSGALALPQPEPGNGGGSGKPGSGKFPPSGGYGKGGSSQQRAQAVIDAFRFAWSGYSTFCFGHDELHPVSNTCGDSRNGWGASAVDALSTAVVMRQADIVKNITGFIPTVDFTKSSIPITVSLFETTIRYIGGMLAGHDLLTGPVSDLGISKSNIDALISQAVSLADSLKFAFNTPTGIPINDLWINNQSFEAGEVTNGLATIGTLVLEWQHLSDLTGNPEYGQLTQKAESFLLNPKPASSVPFPGLTGTNVDVRTGLFQDALGSWNGGDDSAYEYYLKFFVYDSDADNYRNRWTTAADSTIKHLASHPSSRPDLTFLASFNGTDLIFESQHLTCFDGGNFILGGNVLGRQDYIDFGLMLVDGCHDTYESDVTGIGPEAFSWNTTTLPANQTAFYERSGFWIQDGLYDLRPEVIESYYYAYRITRDSKYQDWAWEAFQAINATTRTNSGFSDVSNVNTPGGGQKGDLQESFLFAEVMKYSYLIFAEDAEYQVDFHGENQFVFNTEAHPLKVHGKPI